jgi:hypothetical protein
MPLKFRLKLDVVLDSDAEQKLIEFARQLWTREAGMVAADEQERTEEVPADEIIDGPEDALLELLERNPLLTEVRAQIERMSCGPGEAWPERSTQTASSPRDATEGNEADDDLDEFESGLYLCRWPNSDISIVKADSKREAVVQLDEWAGAEAAWLVPLEACMIDFHLNDAGEIELTEFSEETEEFIWERCYPRLQQVFAGTDPRHQGRGPASGASKRIRRAVEHERKRLWRAQPEAVPAKTELGRKLQRRLRTVGPAADYCVEVAAEEILKGKAGERGKPN